jgi:hypothetical protein
MSVRHQPPRLEPQKEGMAEPAGTTRLAFHARLALMARDLRRDPSLMLREPTTSNSVRE